MVIRFGLKASARRLREPEGTRWHEADGAPGALAVRWLLRVLRGDEPPGIAFFGDLDVAGMPIMARLREIFPGLGAWKPGYAALLDALMRGRIACPRVGIEREPNRSIQSTPGVPMPIRFCCPPYANARGSWIRCFRRAARCPASAVVLLQQC